MHDWEYFNGTDVMCKLSNLDTYSTVENPWHFVLPLNKYIQYGGKKSVVSVTKSPLRLHISIENVTIKVIQLILYQLLAYEVAPFCIDYTFKSNICIGNVSEFDVRMCMMCDRTQQSTGFHP